MQDLLGIGQWQGFYQYGPEYGDMMAGLETEFRLFIEEYDDGQFSGRIMDWDGADVSGEVAIVKGFVNNHFISFTKQYDRAYTYDEFGNPEIVPDAAGNKVVYEGNFDKASNSFTGTWDIRHDIEEIFDFGTIQEVLTGTWRMYNR